MVTKKSETLTVREYARREKITIQTAYRRIWQAQIPARRRYGRWLISPLPPSSILSGASDPTSPQGTPSKIGRQRKGAAHGRVNNLCAFPGCPEPAYTRNAFCLSHAPLLPFDKQTDADSQVQSERLIPSQTGGGSTDKDAGSCCLTSTPVKNFQVHEGKDKITR
jgi:hypothetical protein